MVSNVNNNNNNNNINDNQDNINDNNINESNTNANVMSMVMVGLGGRGLNVTKRSADQVEKKWKTFPARQCLVYHLWVYYNRLSNDVSTCNASSSWNN